MRKLIDKFLYWILEMDLKALWWFYRLYWDCGGEPTYETYRTDLYVCNKIDRVYDMLRDLQE